MEKFALAAQSRQVTGKQVSLLRAEGMVPAVIYGTGIENKNVVVEMRAFDKLFAGAGESTLVDLSVDGGASTKVLIQDVQYDPLRSTPIHVDFRQIRMDQALEVDVTLKFVGEAPAVKAIGAIIVKSMDKVMVRCLPKDLVHEIEVDITGLAAIGDQIKVKDIKLPAGIEVKEDPEGVVVIANEPISEAELAALDTKPEASVADVKVATDEKKKARDEAAAAEKTA
jgi:large subunit ribosomal protein L25